MSLHIFFKKIADSVPGLSSRLLQAGMADDEVDFIKKTFFSAMYMTTGLVICLALILSKVEVEILFLVFVFPFLFVLLFLYFLKLPDMRILKIEKEINREIVYAGRFLMVELESGVALYDSFKHVSDNYPTIGKYFNRIIEEVNLGTTIEDALTNAIDLTPSQNFRKILWQVLNSMSTGTDVAKSLSNAIEQIIKEQKIELNEYGRKLNPLAMFYMIMAVIFPSIGVTMLVILVSFFSIDFSLTLLLIIAGGVGFIQFLFYTVVKSSRPAGQFE